MTNESTQTPAESPVDQLLLPTSNPTQVKSVALLILTTMAVIFALD